MSTSAIGNLSSSFLQQALASALQSVGIAKNTTTASAAGLASPSDSSQVSPRAQLASTLQQLQESDPTKYKQVTEQVATNLQSAAQTAQSQGDTTAARQLNQLAAAFTSASQSGQLPNLQGLAEAAGGGHHHHHARQSSGSSSSDNTSQAVNSGTIISQTLADAGISTAQTR